MQEQAAVHTFDEAEGLASRPARSWTAIVWSSTLAILLLVVMFFYVPQFVLTRLSAPARGARAWLATLWTLVAFVLACYAGWRATRPRVGRAARSSVDVLVPELE